MKPDNWPNGAKETHVRQCNCATCEALIAELERLRAEQSKDGEHKAITAYSDL